MSTFVATEHAIPEPVASFIGATVTPTPDEVTAEGNTVTVIGDWASSRANGRSSFQLAVDVDMIASMTIREG